GGRAPPAGREAKQARPPAPRGGAGAGEGGGGERPPACSGAEEARQTHSRADDGAALQVSAVRATRRACALRSSPRRPKNSSRRDRSIRPISRRATPTFVCT